MMHGQTKIKFTSNVLVFNTIVDGYLSLDKILQENKCSNNVFRI